MFPLAHRLTHVLLLLSPCSPIIFNNSSSIRWMPNSLTTSCSLADNRRGPSGGQKASSGWYSAMQRLFVLGQGRGWNSCSELFEVLKVKLDQMSVDILEESCTEGKNSWSPLILCGYPGCVFVRTWKSFKIERTRLHRRVYSIQRRQAPVALSRKLSCNIHRLHLQKA